MYLYKKFIAVSLTIAALLSFGATAGAANLENLFYKYYSKDIIVDYMDPYGFFPPGVIEDVTYDGYIALKELDMDGEGTTELLAIRIKPSANGTGCTVTADMYTKDGSQMDISDTYILAENVLICEESELTVFIQPKSKGYYLCCEHKDEASTTSDDIYWEFRVASFDEEEFIEYAKVSYDGDQSLKSVRRALKKASDKIGFSTDYIVDEPICDQNIDDLQSLCTIVRKSPGDVEDLLEAMLNGNGDVYYCGYTLFDNYVNWGWQNKEPVAFPSRIANLGYEEENGTVTEDGYLYDDSYNTPVSKPVDYEDPYVYGGYNSYCNEFIFWDSDTRYLSEEELWNLSRDQLRIARNEIYARHGRMFNDSYLRNYFNHTNWYRGTVPASAFDYNYASHVFDSVEIANIDLIRAYEESLSY